MVPGSPSIVRFPCDHEHQQADPGCGAADADSVESTRPGRAQEEAGPQEPQGQGSSSPPWADGQGESELRVQASLLDREATGKPQRVGTGRPEADARVPARIGDLATVRRPDLLAF